MNQTPKGVGGPRRVSRASEPITPLRGSIFWLPAKPCDWVNIPRAQLWKVVALSLGIEPSSLNITNAEFCPTSFRERMRIALAHCNLGLATWTEYQSDVEPAKFRSWAASLPSPLDLPSWFPEAAPKAEPQKEQSNAIIVPSKAALVRPQQAQAAQEEAILAKLIELSYAPKALPATKSGRKGVRAEVWATFGKTPLFQSKVVFEKAWQRLRDSGRIAELKGP